MPAKGKIQLVMIVDENRNPVSSTGGPYIGTTIATLPATPTAGQIATVTDGDAALAWGATAVNSGAGATKYLVWWNGSAWKVVGK